MTADVMTPDIIASVMEATWPPAAQFRAGPWIIRDGRGGGQRVSAATAQGAWSAQDITTAEAAMGALGQSALFLIRAQDAALDKALALRGYQIKDPVVGYIAPCAMLAAAPPSGMTAFAHWPPLEIAKDIWRTAGIGAARVAVMERATGTKAAILGRTKDRPAGAAFVAIAGDVAMLHALEVPEAQRRQGTANNILRAAAVWAQNNGAQTLSLVVTEANSGARALYESRGMLEVGRYHYRCK